MLPPTPVCPTIKVIEDEVSVRRDVPVIITIGQCERDEMAEG